MRLLPIVLAAPLLLAALAGCSDKPIGPGGPGGHLDIDPWPAVQSRMSGVPCDADVGTDTSANLVQLANVSYADEAGIHGELDVRGNLALHARYSSGGFEIVDISNPLEPKDLGAFDYNGDDPGNAFDVKFSPDNATAILGLGDGILLADVRDPLHPVEVGRWLRTDTSAVQDPANGASWNAHMLYAARIAGQDWVFLAPNTSSGVWILKMEGTPEARTLTYVTQTLPLEGGPLGPHDMFVTHDEKDGHWYLYSADGFHGWAVFNVDDPSSPQLAGGWINPAEGAYTHSIQAEWVNGRRLVATIGEVGVNILKVYDATNLRAPLLLGLYQASPGPGSASPEHNFNLVGGKLYLSYYTLGMYIFDLTKLTGTPVADTPNMQPVAHWGNNGEGAPTPLSFSGIWDTVLQDGLIYLSNIEGGLVVVGYGCNTVPDPALTSTG
jgi:hypothetical protein